MGAYLPRTLELLGAGGGSGVFVSGTRLGSVIIYPAGCNVRYIDYYDRVTITTFPSTGSEAVNWFLSNGYAGSKDEAIKLGQVGDTWNKLPIVEHFLKFSHHLSTIMIRVPKSVVEQEPLPELFVISLLSLWIIIAICHHYCCYYFCYYNMITKCQNTLISHGRMCTH